jgi:hypothetical protein
MRSWTPICGYNLSVYTAAKHGLTRAARPTVARRAYASMPSVRVRSTPRSSRTCAMLWLIACNSASYWGASAHQRRWPEPSCGHRTSSDTRCPLMEAWSPAAQ